MATDLRIVANRWLSERWLSEPEFAKTYRKARRVASWRHKDNDEVLKFEMKVVGDGQAELTILDAPVRIKPIHFARK